MLKHILQCYIAFNIVALVFIIFAYFLEKRFLLFEGIDVGLFEADEDFVLRKYHILLMFMFPITLIILGTIKGLFVLIKLLIIAILHPIKKVGMWLNEPVNKASGK